MKYKLHNKYEITKNGKTIVAYNTIVNQIYTKIANLEEFTSRIAVGTGTTEPTFSDTKLTTYASSFALATEEICSDITKETLFLKKVVDFDETNQTQVSFCELGLCTSSASNPDIYTHVLLKDSDGNVVTVTRNAGDIMQIRITIYLELSSESTAHFTPGENPLIKRLLGENFDVEDTNLYIAKGECLAENILIERSTPGQETKKFKCSNQTTISGTEYTITFSAKLGKGTAEEMLVIFAGKVCMRENVLDSLDSSSLTKVLTLSTDNIAEIDSNVKTISSITDGETDLTDSANVKKYATKVIIKNQTPFDENFSNSDRRFVSLDGQMIAYIKNSALYLYKYQNYAFKRIYANLPATNIINLCMFDDKLVFILSESPYIRIYDTSNNTVIEEEVSLSHFNLTSYSYNWYKAAAVSTANGKIIIGLILNNENKTPIALRLSKNTSGIWTDEVVRPESDYADSVVAIYKTPYSESRVAYISSKLEGDITYSLEEIYENSIGYNGGSVVSFGLLKNADEIKNGGKIIFANKTGDTLFKAYYLPSYTYAGDNFSTGIKHWVSYDGDYMIAKYSDNSYKLFTSYYEKTLTEFEDGYKSLIDFENATDFEFVGDFLLVFTNSQEAPVYSVMLKKNKTRVDNISGTNLSASYSKYNILGSNEGDGVMFSLSLKFGEEQSEA